MIKTIIKIAVITGALFAILATIPELFSPFLSMVDSAFSLELLSFMNNFYSVVPDDMLDLMTVGFSLLAAGILASWLLKGGENQ